MFCNNTQTGDNIVNRIAVIIASQMHIYKVRLSSLFWRTSSSQIDSNFFKIFSSIELSFASYAVESFRASYFFCVC